MSHHKGVLELWLKFGGDIVVPMGGGYVYILYEARLPQHARWRQNEGHNDARGMSLGEMERRH
eukprot:COSAG05_NODE_169_length_15161_cov_279.150644_8_plen_63_part_00